MREAHGQIVKRHWGKLSCEVPLEGAGAFRAEDVCLFGLGRDLAFRVESLGFRVCMGLRFMFRLGFQNGMSTCRVLPGPP